MLAIIGTPPMPPLWPHHLHHRHAAAGHALGDSRTRRGIWMMLLVLLLLREHRRRDKSQEYHETRHKLSVEA
jgi:hypothetical protein